MKMSYGSFRGGRNLVKDEKKAMNEDGWMLVHAANNFR